MNPSDRETESANRFDLPPHWWHAFRISLQEHRWLVIGTLWVAAYILGCVGTARQFAITGTEHSIWDIFYCPLQLFTMNYGGLVSGPIRSWELEVARFLSPAVAAYTAFLALFSLFHSRIEALRLSHMKHHTVICGVGRHGMALVRDFRRHGDAVVVIELNEGNDNLGTCRQLGALVLVGDATEQVLLQRARVHTANRVVTLTDDDGSNVEIALQTYQLAKDRRSPSQGAVRCFVHIRDLRLCQLFLHHSIFCETHDTFELTFFNLYRNGARQLLEKHPLDWDRITPDDSRDIRLLIIGMGQMGESIVLQAVRIGHFAHGRKLQVTVLDLDAEKHRRRFYYRYPQIDQVCSLRFIQGEAEDPEIICDLRDWLLDPLALPTVVVALNDDELGLSCALGLLSVLDNPHLPILVRMTQEDGLAVLIESETTVRQGFQFLHTFGMPSSICTRRILLREELDGLARAIHEAYVEERIKEGCPSNDPSLRPWELLDPALQDSNRQQADHIAVKLRAIGCRTAAMGNESAPLVTLSADEIELMARMEHARWVAERFLGGWRYGDTKDVEKKISPYLVEWSTLPEEIRQYDRDTVRMMPEFLREVGMEIYRQINIR